MYSLTKPACVGHYLMMKQQGFFYIVYSQSYHNGTFTLKKHYYVYRLYRLKTNALTFEINGQVCYKSATNLAGLETVNSLRVAIKAALAYPQQTKVIIKLHPFN